MSAATDSLVLLSRLTIECPALLAFDPTGSLGASSLDADTRTGSELLLLSPRPMSLQAEPALGRTSTGLVVSRTGRIAGGQHEPPPVRQTNHIRTSDGRSVDDGHGR